MTELFPLLIAVACPLGMVMMMALPAVGRLVTRRDNSTGPHGG